MILDEIQGGAQTDISCLRLLVRELVTTSSSEMAWRSHGTDNPSLVDKLQEHDIVKSPEVADQNFDRYTEFIY